MHQNVVITGLGVVTAIGDSPELLLRAIQNGKKVPTHEAPKALSGVHIAPIVQFNPELWIPEPKSLRMMSREAQLAVAAATLAMRDAGVTSGTTYAPHQIALMGATGLAGVPLDEVSRLVIASAGTQGDLDLRKFGADALRQVRPVLSFKILSNMPLCFVSIILNVQGPNAVFNPWEEQGAQAIAAGANAIRYGRCKAALVGGTDVKTHELALLALKQQGAFARGALTIGEGAAFLLLEQEHAARQRNARIYARLVRSGMEPAAGDGDGAVISTGTTPLVQRQSGLPKRLLAPKDSLGDLFAAASAVQVAMGSLWCSRGCAKVHAHCAGHGGRPWLFVLEAA